MKKIYKNNDNIVVMATINGDCDIIAPVRTSFVTGEFFFTVTEKIDPKKIAQTLAKDLASYDSVITVQNVGRYDNKFVYKFIVSLEEWNMEQAYEEQNSVINGDEFYVRLGANRFDPKKNDMNKLILDDECSCSDATKQIENDLAAIESDMAALDEYADDDDEIEIVEDDKSSSEIEELINALDEGFNEEKVRNDAASERDTLIEDAKKKVSNEDEQIAALEAQIALLKKKRDRDQRIINSLVATRDEYIEEAVSTASNEYTIKRGELEEQKRVAEAREEAKRKEEMANALLAEFMQRMKDAGFSDDEIVAKMRG